jgi:rRNA maturation RNase YbeY
MKNLKVFSVDKSVIKKNIHRVISRLIQHFGLQFISIEVNIVNSKIVLELNKLYLKHNYKTDILTFNYSSAETVLEGEIYISIDDALENSKRFKNSLNEELKRLIIHGILHLIGYNDNSPNQKKRMKEMEDKSLKLFEDLSIIK